MIGRRRYGAAVTGLRRVLDRTEPDERVYDAGDPGTWLRRVAGLYLARR